MQIKISPLLAGLLCFGGAAFGAESVSLEAVEVAEESRNDEANYAAKELVKSTTRLDLSTRDTPQSLSVLTAAKLRDLNVNDYQNMLRYVAGVTLNKWDERVYPKARGFEIDYYLLDSMPSFGGFSLGANDMSLLPYDRVEIVKGANGLLAGAGNPAASMNFIRKRAESKEPKASISLSAGSYDKYSIKADASSALNSDGSVRGRLAFMGEKAGSYMDYYNRKNAAIYGVVDSDIGDSSWLGLGAFYQDLRRHGIRWGGMPAFRSDGSRYEFSRSEIFSQPWTRWDIRTLDFYADFRHYFENDASLNLSYSFRRANTDTNLLYYGGKVNSDNTGSIDVLSVYANKREENIHNVDAYFKLPYELWGVGQEFVFGGMYNNYLKSADNVSSYWNNKTTAAGLAYTARTRIDFNNLKIDDPRFSYVGQANAERTTQKAVYFANKFSPIDSFKFIFGARLSYYKVSTQNKSGDREFKNELTPYLGVVYTLDANHSLYASYTSIFKPQTVKSIDGKYLDPIVGKDYEAGIKGEYFDGALQASAGVFKIIQDKIGVKTGQKIAATGADAYAPARGVVSKGFEIDVNGKINENIELSLALAHFNAKDADGNKFDTEQARTSANLFAKYSQDSFRVGAGARYASRIYTGSGDSLIEQKAYVLANLMLGYKIGKSFDVQLNVDNLFNKKYFEGIGANKMVYGDPRTFNLTFTYNYN